MSYVTLQAATQVILQNVTGFLDSTNVTLGDYGVLDQGEDHCAVLHASLVMDAGTAARQTDREYHILVDLFRRWLNDSDTLQLFAVFRDAVLAQLDAYPTLNLSGTVRVMGVGADNEPLHVDDSNGQGPFFVMQRIRVRVRENVMQTGGEYA